MACQAMHTWSLIGLVGAFLDLAIAYFLLCASAMTFVASKFLGFFGLCLPCPCDGIFVTHPNRNLCYQKLFIEYPTEKVSNVQLSVRSKFPFDDSTWGKVQNCELNLRLIGGKERDVLELEGEASCSSVSDAGKSRNVVRIKGELNARNEVGAMKFLGTREGRFDMKGKGIMHHKPRSGVRHRRKGGFDHGKCSSVASYGPPFEDVQGDPESPPGIIRGGNEFVEDDIELLSNGSDNDEAPSVIRLGQRVLNVSDLNEVSDEDEHKEKDVPSIRKLESGRQAGLGFSSDDKSTIIFLKQALEEEHAACAALYIELEKERSAAASAADEAMAMIQRLQEEKALIVMEARQYRRIIEEKSTYDAEEMNILKEIIVRREREKHFLEKQVEAFGQMMYLGNEQSAGNSEDVAGTQPQLFDSSLDPNEDPVLMLYQLSASIDKKVMTESRHSDEVISIGKQKGTAGAWEERPIHGWTENSDLDEQRHPPEELPQISVCGNDGNQELQDKMAPVDNNSYAPPGFETFTQSCKPGSSEEKFPKENISLMAKGTDHLDSKKPYPVVGQSRDKELHVHDVHVIVDQSNLCDLVTRGKEAINSTLEFHMKNNLSSEASGSHRVGAVIDCQSTSNWDSEGDIKRSSSDMTRMLPPRGPKGKSVLSDLRRNSVSAVDNERSKIDNEIGWLRERLRIVQEDREKFNLSVEHREREKRQLKLLEDIAYQTQEIRQLAEPGKAVRQASLPLPSSKAISKKRRCRSVSLGQQTNS